MTTRIISPEEMQLLRQEFARSGLSETFELLGNSRLRLVDAPEIGCMPIVLEHVCQIDSPTEQYLQLSALPAQTKEELRQVLARFFQAGNPDINLADVDFYRQE